MAVLPYWQKLTSRGKVKSLSYTAAAPLTLTPLPAGHQPGTYIVCLSYVLRAVGTAGTLVRSTTWTDPLAGAVTLSSGTSNLTGANNTPFSLAIAVESSGGGPISFVLTPAGVTGSPSLDVYVAAMMVGPSV